MIAGTALAAVLPACAELDTIGRPVTTTSYRFVATDDAAMRLRNARVSRDVACDGVGAGHRYGNLDAALDDRGKSSVAHLAQCRTGVADVPLDGCIAQVKAVPCGVLVEGLDDLPACRRGDICLPR
ncbi:MAG: hypothetical protein JST00_47070 [Deltaproteobacteria bacterium]|nr:hypothetical protein [Deltaproteobacteria bacterium]